MFVVAAGVVADHPCMCKLSGLADHAHNVAPCTNCKATKANMFSDDALKNGTLVPQPRSLDRGLANCDRATGTPLRTSKEHKQLSSEYRRLKSDVERSKFAKEHGVRWTEFTRLHYFDPIRMMIIDPMHCILLGARHTFHLFPSLTEPAGLAKNQWFARWIQAKALRADTESGTKRELNDFQLFLDTVRFLFLYIPLSLHLICADRWRYPPGRGSCPLGWVIPPAALSAPTNTSS